MERYNEDELLYLTRCGSEVARDCLYEIYYHRMKSWMQSFYKYHYLGIDLEDFIQVGMMGFCSALSSYRSDRNTSLCTYVKSVVIKRAYSLLANHKDRYSLKGLYSFSLDDYMNLDDGLRYDEVVADNRVTYQPQKIFEVRETTTYYLTQLNQRGSSVENKVMKYYLAGYQEIEIAKILHISIRSVYNALYRSHKKVCH